MATITALFVPADSAAKPELRELERSTALDALQAAVGGYVEVVHLPGVKADMFINEEGKLCGKARNVRATALAGMLYSGLGLGDYIAGDAVITGAPDEDGDAAGLDPLQVHELTGALRQI